MDFFTELVAQHGWVVVVYWLFNALVQSAPSEKEILSWWGRWAIRILHFAAGNLRLIDPKHIPQFNARAKYGRRGGDTQAL